MLRKVRPLVLCLGLLVSAAALQASPSAEPQTPAERLATTSEARQLFTIILKGMVPQGPAGTLIDLLAEDDPSLWEDLDAHYAQLLNASNDTETLNQFLDFFDSPLGRKWNQTTVKMLEQAMTDIDAAPTEFSGKERSPLGRLVQIFELDGDSATLVETTFSKKEIKKVAKFYDSPLGQQWMTTAEEIQQTLQSDFSPGTVMRRFAVLGCLAGIVAPNLEAALQSAGVDGSKVTKDDLRPMVARLGPAESICECAIGEVIDQIGAEGFISLQAGDAEAMATFQTVLESGDCIPAEFRQEPTTAIRATLLEIRDTGTAMMQWATDQITGEESADPSLLAASGEGWSMIPEGKTEPVSFSKISPQNLEKLLVPKYLEELPRTDGWGHDLEFAINPDLLSEYTLSIRSPGQDGLFEESPYASGSFSPERDGLDRDLVYADGYWVVWPFEGEEEEQEEEEEENPADQ